VSAPTAKAPAGIVKLAAPLASVCCALYVPLARITVPVGVVAPLAPATVIAMLSVCSFVIVAADGVTVTVDVPVPIGFTAKLYAAEVAEL
jgi:hypothetical protein